MDGPMKRLHIGLINVMMCPVVGGVIGVSITINFGAWGHHSAIVWLTQANTSGRA